VPMARSTLIASLQLSLRSAVAAGLAVAVAQLLRFQFPIYALVSAVIVTDLSAARTRQLALPRVVGTVLGATLGAVINPFVQPGAWRLDSSVLAANAAQPSVAPAGHGKVGGLRLGHRRDQSWGPSVVLLRCIACWRRAWYRAWPCWWPSCPSSYG